MNDEKSKIEELHWLVRPETIRKLWWGGSIVLGLLVLADLVIPPHPYFGIDGSFGFYAWYGFATCAAMVIGAKALAIFLKRNDTYYGEDTQGGGKDNA
jgi:hypothetical protein